MALSACSSNLETDMVWYCEPIYLKKLDTIVDDLKIWVTEKGCCDVQRIEFTLFNLRYSIQFNDATNFIKFVNNCGYDGYSKLCIMRHIIDNLGDFVVKDY